MLATWVAASVGLTSKELLIHRQLDTLKPPAVEAPTFRETLPPMPPEFFEPQVRADAAFFP